MLHLIEKVLREDANIHTANSGTEAISALERHPVSAVLCDLRMPDMSGIDVLRASKRLQPAAEFVLMTAYASVPTAVEAMREGAYDYITKPFDPDGLRAVVLRALNQASIPPVPGAAHESEKSSLGLAALEAARGSDSLNVEHLSPEIAATDSPELSTSLTSKKWHEAIDVGRKEAGRQYLQAVLKRYGGRVAEAALHAGVERESFYRLLRRYGVQLDGSAVDPEK